jgi:histone H3/H4
MTTKLTESTPKKTRKERRAEKEYMALVERTTFILPKTTFKRLVTSTTRDLGCPTVRYSQEAIAALQTASENELTSVLRGAGMCASLGKRDTITVADIQNFQALRNM